jgi:hypothetical protein
MKSRARADQGKASGNMKKMRSGGGDGPAPYLRGGVRAWRRGGGVVDEGVFDVLVAEESGEEAAIYGEPRVVADAEDLPLVRRELAGRIRSSRDRRRRGLRLRRGRRRTPRWLARQL